MFQHENYDISEMREYFCTKCCPFVYKTTMHKCAGAVAYLLCIRQINGNENFTNEFCNSTEG